MKPKHLKFPYRFEQRRPELHDGVLFVPDFYDKHREWNFPTWQEIFGNSNPVMIEYCTGNGTWIADKAKDKKCNWVAVEWRFDRVQKIWSKKKNQALDNLLVVCGDAQVFIREYLKDLSVHGVYINFPDPWPKEKHAKNRLFQPSFISQMSRTVCPEGFMIVVTDDHVYAQQITETVLENRFWEPRLPFPYYKTEWEGYGTSYFDRLWRDKGLEIKYFEFIKKDSV
jgi:tRNA (guanine-N7-)-methyltransferase